MAKVVVQDEGRSDTPFTVVEVDDVGSVVATLGNYETHKEASQEASAYASASGVDVEDHIISPPTVEEGV